MTIRYVNQKGLVFVINVRLKGDDSINVHIQLFSTRSPILVKKTFSIPYGHDGIIPPFDFNDLEEGIRHMLAIMYRNTTFDEFKHEDMTELVDILIMNGAPVVDIQVFDEYDVCTNVCV
ncbi:C1 protein [Tomato leaf curl Bangalore betasatellite]|uniref:C1 protein n=1 Tax=Tomato leaf curl Bangalore betasatellite TaxID=2010331 RepID=Q6T886_9VIRU|nr:C1 protein [Tomato leaf curl Bangalore betasatellite]AAR28535.1 C1 protein [Tomato leaf curl Bangalore betasatellite]